MHTMFSDVAVVMKWTGPCRLITLCFHNQNANKILISHNIYANIFLKGM